MSELPQAGAASEEALLERARGGEMAAFEQLVMLYAERLFTTLRNFGLTDAEAQEVAQETFLRAWRSLPGFEGRSRFFTWLYRIGFNEAQRRLARRPAAGALVSIEQHSLEDVPGALEAGPQAHAEANELRAILRRALGELPIDLRAPVVLRDVEGLSTQQAASVLELGEAAFKSRLHRGRMALRVLLAPVIAGGRP
jgi:RNA polymerase sigma-70 factor (ECF subfamily)